MRYLVVAAVEQELTAIRRELADRENIEFFACGVGSVAAAAELSAKLAQTDRHNLAAIFVGSCGALNKNVALLSIATSTEVLLTEQSLIEGGSYQPEIMCKQIAADPKLLQKFSNSQQGPFYSANGITSSADVAAKFSLEIPSGFENLELFGIAMACTTHQVPWVAVSCVTNLVGPNAHSEWKKNFPIAALNTANYIKSFF